MHKINTKQSRRISKKNANYAKPKLKKEDRNDKKLQVNKSLQSCKTYIINNGEEKAGGSFFFYFFKTKFQH